MIPPKSWQLLWLCWSLLILLSLVFLKVKMAMAEAEPFITIRDFVAWFLGIFSAVVVYYIVHLIQSRLSRYPQKLFKTEFQTTAGYEQPKFGKSLIISIGQHKLFFFIDTKRECRDVRIVGIRPQISKPWHKHWFRSYNKSTQNIALDDRANPPIQIKSIKDVSLGSSENFNRDGDDESCGRWGVYKPPLLITPDRLLIYEVEIEALKRWRGYIDFRIETKDGMRVAHHPCEIQTE